MSVSSTTPVFGASHVRHDADLILTNDPFVTPIKLGVDHLTAIKSSVIPKLRTGVRAKKAGMPIANITDDFIGAKPDMGAIIEGRPIPRYGAVRE